MGISFDRVSWLNGANIYEVNIRQYTQEGTFAAFANHLPRLRDMGVKILWLMPVTPISKEKRLGSLGSYYACSSYVTINPEFGNLDDFKTLVNTAHQLGFKLIIDWVANHTGWDHEWTKENPDWFIKDDQGNFTEKNGWQDVIDLDYSKTAMRNAMIDAMQYWIRECDIDGFRCDMAHLVPLDFWKEARIKCDAIKPLCWLAECEEIEYHEVFDITYAWEWMRITEHIVKQGYALQTKRDVLLKYAQYPKGADKLFFTSNHDENSWNGTEYEKYGDAVKALAVFACTWQGMPLIYSGQELPNYKRLKFFDKDSIDWTSNIALHNFYKKLLELRYKNKALHNDATLFILDTAADDKMLAYILVQEHNKVLVLLNLSPYGKTRFTILHEHLSGKYYSLFSNLQYELSDAQNFELQAWEYLVYVSVE